MPGDDEQGPKARQFGDDVFGNAVRKILLFDVITEVDERQYDEGGFVRQRQRPNRGSIGNLLDRAGEAVTEATNGLDDVVIVCDRAPGFHDASSKRALGHNRSGPDLVLQFVLVDGAVTVYVIRYTSRSNAFGSVPTNSSPRQISREVRTIRQSPKRYSRIAGCVHRRDMVAVSS